MYKSKKTKKSTIIIVVLVTLFLLSISFYFSRKITFIENGLKSISNTFNEILFKPITLYNSEAETVKWKLSYTKKY